MKKKNQILHTGSFLLNDKKKSVLYGHVRGFSRFKSLGRVDGYFIKDIIPMIEHETFTEVRIHETWPYSLSEWLYGVVEQMITIRTLLARGEPMEDFSLYVEESDTIAKGIQDPGWPPLQKEASCTIKHHDLEAVAGYMKGMPLSLDNSFLWTGVFPLTDKVSGATFGFVDGVSPIPFREEGMIRLFFRQNLVPLLEDEDFLKFRLTESWSLTLANAILRMTPQNRFLRALIRDGETLSRSKHWIPRSAFDSPDDPGWPCAPPPKPKRKRES